MEKTDSGRPDELIDNTEPVSRKPRTSGTRSRGRKGRRRADSGRYLIARLLVLVCLVLVVFEGNVIYRLFTHHVGRSVEIMNNAANPQTEGLLQDSASPDVASATLEDTPTEGGSTSVVALAGGALDDSLSGTSSSSSPSTDSSSSSESTISALSRLRNRSTIRRFSSTGNPPLTIRSSATRSSSATPAWRDSGMPPASRREPS